MEGHALTAHIDHHAWWVVLLISVFNVLPTVLAALASGAAFVWYCIKIYKELKHIDDLTDDGDKK